MSRCLLASSAQLSAESEFDRLCTRISVSGHVGGDASVSTGPAGYGAFAGHPEVAVVGLSCFPSYSRHTRATLLHRRRLADRSDSQLEIVGPSTVSGSSPGLLKGSEFRDGPEDRPSAHWITGDHEVGAVTTESGPAPRFGRFVTTPRYDRSQPRVINSDSAPAQTSSTVHAPVADLLKRLDRDLQQWDAEQGQLFAALRANPASSPGHHAGPSDPVRIRLRWLMGEAAEIRYQYRVAHDGRDVGAVSDNGLAMDQSRTPSEPGACYDEVALLVARLDRVLTASQALRRGLLRSSGTGAEAGEADDEIWSILGL